MMENRNDENVNNFVNELKKRIESDTIIGLNWLEKEVLIQLVEEVRQDFRKSK